MPFFEPERDPPAGAETGTLLDKNILRIILLAPKEEHEWIDKRRMLRRVHSLRLQEAREIYPDQSDRPLAGKPTWGTVFHKSRDRARGFFKVIKEQPHLSHYPAVKDIMELLEIFPATLDIQLSSVSELAARLILD